MPLHLLYQPPAVCTRSTQQAGPHGPDHSRKLKAGARAARAPPWQGVSLQCVHAQHIMQAEADPCHRKGIQETGSPAGRKL